MYIPTSSRCLHKSAIALSTPALSVTSSAVAAASVRAPFPSFATWTFMVERPLGMRFFSSLTSTASRKHTRSDAKSLQWQTKTNQPPSISSPCAVAQELRMPLSPAVGTLLELPASASCSRRLTIQRIEFAYASCLSASISSSGKALQVQP